MHTTKTLTGTLSTDKTADAVEDYPAVELPQSEQRSTLSNLPGDSPFIWVAYAAADRLRALSAVFMA